MGTELSWAGVMVMAKKTGIYTGHTKTKVLHKGDLFVQEGQKAGVRDKDRR